MEEQQLSMQLGCPGHRAPCRPMSLGHHRDAHKSLPQSGPRSSHLPNGFSPPHPTQLIKADRAEKTLERKIQ